jgi:hypothetical protein
MAYTVPQFPLLCNIASGGSTWPIVPRITNVKCNLAFGRRVETHNSTDGSLNMSLLVPAGTDIRGGATPASPGNDIVECPAGSGRTYKVLAVDDIGKGFSNEHRIAILAAVSMAQVGGGTHYWPVPIP